MCAQIVKFAGSLIRTQLIITIVIGDFSITNVHVIFTNIIYYVRSKKVIVFRDLEV